MADSDRKIKWRSSLRGRFVFIPMAVTALFLLIVGSCLIWIARQALRETVFQTQEKHADTIALMISHYIKHGLEDLELFEKMQDLPGLEYARQRDAIENFMINRKHIFNQIALLDINGHERIKISRYHSFLNSELGSIEKSDAHKMISVEGRYISDIYISPESGLLSLEAAVPVRKHGNNTYGFLLAEVNINTLWQEISHIHIGRQGYAYIIDKKGRFVAYQEPSIILQRYGEILEDIPTVNQFIRDKGEATRTAYEYKGLKGGDVIGAFAPISGTGWAIVAELPKDEAYAGIKEMEIYLLIFASLGLLTAGIIGFLISHKMVSHILSLIHTAERIGEGDLDAPIPEVNRDDEIGILARTFNKMQAELKNLYKNLDMQVHSLTKTKEALQENAEKLHMANQRMSEIIEFLPDATFVVDGNKKIIAWNKASEEITGIAKADIIGTDEYARAFYGIRRPILADFVMSGHGLADDELKKYYLSVQKKGSILYGISRTTHLSNKDIEFLSGVACPLFDRSGDITGAIESIRDITEVKRLEMQVMQSKKLDTIGTLAGGVAHDFNNLLMGILGYINLMLHDKGLSKTQYNMLKKIEHQALSGAELSKRLLGFARGGRYEVSPTYLNNIIEKTVDTFSRTRKDIVIYEDYEKEPWTSEVDRIQMEQVVLNMLINAGEAMPDGGTLYIESKNVELSDKIALQYDLQPGRYVKFSIRDTGKGMDNKTLERVFDPFYTTKEMGKGAGLGLASAYGIIKAHGGSIHVESEIGRGSRFTVFLPASDKAAEIKVSIEKKIEKGNELILLVDDEEIVLDVASAMLEALGYKVITAKSGSEAIDLYRKKGSHIDLVIMDMIMPRMGGGELFDALKDINPDVRILLSSGYSIDGKAREIMNKGCNGFIQKPFKLDDLSQKIREILNS